MNAWTNEFIVICGIGISSATTCSRLKSPVGNQYCNDKIREKFAQYPKELLTPRKESHELIELVKCSSEFKNVTKPKLVSECSQIKNWLDFMFGMGHQMYPGVLKNVRSSRTWNSIVKQSVSVVTKELSGMEMSSTEKHDTLISQLVWCGQRVETFGESG
eukprot:724755_1